MYTYIYIYILCIKIWLITLHPFVHERHLHLHVLHLIAVGALPRAWCGALGVEDSPDRHPSKVAKIFSHPIKKKNQRIATSEKKKKKVPRRASYWCRGGGRRMLLWLGPSQGFTPQPRKQRKNSNITCAMVKSGNFTGNGHGPPLIGKFSLVIWVFGKKGNSIGLMSWSPIIWKQWELRP